MDKAGNAIPTPASLVCHVGSAEVLECDILICFSPQILTEDPHLQSITIYLKSAVCIWNVSSNVEVTAGMTPTISNNTQLI